jgi:ABC-type amino acid transport substrate-binding protein
MRCVCAGSLHVALPPGRAAALFTPEGERRWAHGWAPEYPADGPVFVTNDGATVWIELGDLRYARVTPGVQAGTVAVRLAPDGDGTRAEVTYDLTALSGDAGLAAFAAGFDEMMAAWERAIAAAL